jgi:thiamine biosynthesis lipoprotein
MLARADVRTAYWGLIPVLILIVLSGLPSVSRSASAQKRLTWYTGITMGTHYSVKLTELPPEIDPKSLETEVARLLEGVNSLLSTYQSDSEISRFNRNLSTDWVEISPELVMVLQKAQKLSQLTEGGFDVTIGPLVNLWGFGADAYDQKVPSANQLQAAMEKVGYRQLHIRQSPPALKKARADIYIDLSAIGEGYGIDRLAEFLEAKGIHDYFVDIGGEQRMKGQSPHHTPWRIGIERPEPGESTLQRIIELETGAVATSGDYRTYFEQNGWRYSHIIDPRTGRPIDHTLASVTVIGQTAMHADALATALMVLGPEKGLELAEREQLAALLIIRRSEDRFVEKATTAFAHRFIH